MNHILSWNKDNFINEDYISTKREDQWIFKSKGDIKDGTILLQINKTCLFSGKNCTVSTLFDSNEDEMFKITVGFIYEMFIFDPKMSQWYEYLSPLIKYYNQYKKDKNVSIEKGNMEWEKKFYHYYNLWNQNFGWKFIENTLFDFKMVSNFIKSFIVMIDCWLGPCLLPGGIVPSKTGLDACNSTLISLQDVCTLCGEEDCYCEEESDNEYESDINDDNENEYGDMEEDFEEQEKEDTPSLVKKDCITIVAGSDTTDGSIKSLIPECTLTIHVMDTTELQYSNLFNTENTEEQQIWFYEDGNPSDWLLYQLDPYSNLTDQQLNTKLRNVIISELIELKNQNISKMDETYVILRKALKKSYK